MSEVDSLEVAFHESARAVKSGLLDSAKTLTESRKQLDLQNKRLKTRLISLGFLLHISLLYLSPNCNEYKTSLVSAFRNFPKQSQDVEVRIKETVVV